jgi:hypothetical protein
MTVTYEHSDMKEHNPIPPSFDVLSAVGKAIEDAALKGASPLTRGPDIMGIKLSPSPEIFGAQCGVLEVDYSDGKTLTFDVDVQGEIVPRKYAYAYAAVLETDEQLSEEQMETVLSFIGDTFLNCEEIEASVEFASTPRPTKYRPQDDYAIPALR